MSKEPRKDPLTPEEREEFEEDLVFFCDRQLELLGDIRGLDVLYAGGSSLLWIEGLSQMIGEKGSLTVLDLDKEALEDTRESLAEADLLAPVSLVAGNVFEPPFRDGTFDLVYSAGLFHELDVSERTAEEALGALASTVRRSGRLATTDFVDSVPALQIEDECLQAMVRRESYGEKPYGIGGPERLVKLHESVLKNVDWRILAPYSLKYFEKIALAGEEPEELIPLAAEAQDNWRKRRSKLRERIRHEGYTRPATLYLEGNVSGG